jgi:DNA-directed RNA polymerase subunit N (RpoN/RPB10)
MIIPVKCFTCGKVLADKWVAYETEVDKLMQHDTDEKKSVAKKSKGTATTTSSTPMQMHASFDTHVRGQVLDKLGLTKICCRRHMLGHVNFD